MTDKNKTESMPGIQPKMGQRMETSVMGDGAKGSAAASELLIGRVLKGRQRNYRITDVLDASTGGESDLYLCKEEGREEKDAPVFTAKVYHSARRINFEIREKLLNFLTNIDMNKSNILPILDYGEIDSTIFDIMPYMKRGDLSRHGKFSFKELFNKIIPQLNETLREIHRAGFIHRDIKPRNLYMTDDGRVVVGDFGIASENVSEINMTHGRGTDGYRAPELNDHVVTQKSDYFSLGITIASLYKGEEIFDGIDDYLIGSRIIGKNLPLDIDEADSDLGKLIYGLIEYNPSLRFGYEEVRRWCSNPKDVTVPQTKYTYSMAYRFEQGSYSDPVTLSEALAVKWDWACKHLYKGKLEKYFDEVDQELALRANEIVERECKNDRDLGLFKFLYYLNSGISFYWRGKKYKSIADIARRIFENPDVIDPDILAMLKSGAISWRIERTRGEAPGTKETLDRIRSIETMAKKGREGMAYYLFGYEYTDDKYFPIGKSRARNVDEVFDAITGSAADFYAHCDKLLSSDHFYAFITFLGYGDAARELINSLGDDKVDNYNLLMTLFYEIVSDKKAVADFYIKYGTKGHLYWIKQNLGLYRFSGSEAVIIKSNIENIKINNTMSLTEINYRFEILQKHVIGFQKIFHDNIFLSYMGIYGGFETKGITSNNSDAFFVYDFLGRKAPGGFKRYIEGIAETPPVDDTDAALSEA